MRERLPELFNPFAFCVNAVLTSPCWVRAIHPGEHDVKLWLWLPAHTQRQLGTDQAHYIKNNLPVSRDLREHVFNMKVLRLCRFVSPCHFRTTVVN